MSTLMLAIWLGGSFIFLTEGLLLMISPKMWKLTVEQMTMRPIEILQKIGFSMGFVAVTMAALWHFFPQTLGTAWLGFAMMALMEGLIFGAFPHYWKKKMTTLTTLPDQKLRQLGMLLFISGGFIFIYVSGK